MWGAAVERSSYALTCCVRVPAVFPPPPPREQRANRGQAVLGVMRARDSTTISSTTHARSSFSLCVESSPAAPRMDRRSRRTAPGPTSARAVPEDRIKKRGGFSVGGREILAGRFVSADTVSPNAPGTQGYNPYAYAANSPTVWTDRNGHAIGTAALPTVEELIQIVFGARGRSIGHAGARPASR